MSARNWDIVLGLFFVAVGALLLFVWVPLDIESGITERHRRRVSIGDAMAPSFVAVGFLLCGALQAWTAWRRHAPPLRAPGLDRRNMAYLAALFALAAVALVLMRWLGPAVVALLDLLGADLPGYRALRDTAPWKYLGYLAGGFVLVFGLIAFIEHKVSWRTALLALIATAVLAALYDLPFDDLLLPPNGDV